MKILFVDDEPMLLAGLQRSLRHMRHTWDMEFVTSGAAALEVMKHASFDVIVSDMRMPGMTGAELLEHVRVNYPHTIRFVLSGQLDTNLTLQRVTPEAHQYLAKPCSPEELTSKICRALELKTLLSNSALIRVISGIRSLPSLPLIYQELMGVIKSDSASVCKIASIIERDMAMTSKVLQLVNSAFFGIGSRISSAVNAVQVLGTETVTSLVLSLEVFSQFSFDREWEVKAQRIWDHALHTAQMAQTIARLAGLKEGEAKSCFTAGLLHDIGLLILVSKYGDEFRAIHELALRGNINMWDAEHEVLGCTHAEIGAYLLGLWGLPSEIVEAVAWHHFPSRSPISTVSPLLAVHLSDTFHLQGLPQQPEIGSKYDEAFVSRCCVSDKVAEWATRCKQV